uniref:Secreted protein n=1 Tax=Globodera rostochiensis TaxID=31243 RepID=A0A914IDB0_GLORO
MAEGMESEATPAAPFVNIMAGETEGNVSSAPAPPVEDCFEVVVEFKSADGFTDRSRLRLRISKILVPRFRPISTFT